jgi:hypothetical protein
MPPSAIPTRVPNLDGIKQEEEEGAPNTEADLAPSHFIEWTSVHLPFLKRPNDAGDKAIVRWLQADERLKSSLSLETRAPQARESNAADLGLAGLDHPPTPEHRGVLILSTLVNFNLCFPPRGRAFSLPFCAVLV